MLHGEKQMPQNPPLVPRISRSCYAAPSLKLTAPSRSVSPTDAVPPLLHGENSSRRIVAAGNLEHMSRASQSSVAQQIDGGVNPDLKSPILTYVERHCRRAPVRLPQSKNRP